MPETASALTALAAVLALGFQLVASPAPVAPLALSAAMRLRLALLVPMVVKVPPA